MKTVTIQGHSLTSSPFDIRKSSNLNYMDRLHRNAVPEDLRVQYALKNPHRPVPYHPKQCCHNILKLCSLAAREGSLEEHSPRLEGYVTEIMNHSIERESALYVGFPFDHEEYGKKLLAPWYSGLSQGFLLGAWIKLYRTTGDGAYLDLAARTFQSFLQFRREPGQNSPWVSFVDERGCLWFEEYPCGRDPQTRILNGHVYALMGIYSYYLEKADEDSLRLLQAGASTVRQYFHAFRRPGMTNRYCLLPGSLPDYMPERSILQQEWLFHITGDPVFERQWLEFLSDMSYHEKAYRILQKEQGWTGN